MCLCYFSTLVSQLTYSVGYPIPAFNWYIPRDPENRTLEQQLSQIKAVPYFGTPLRPQQIVLAQQMTPQQQQIFATAAMKAWSDDRDGKRVNVHLYRQQLTFSLHQLV